MGRKTYDNFHKCTILQHPFFPSILSNNSVLNVEGDLFEIELKDKNKMHCHSSCLIYFRVLHFLTATYSPPWHEDGYQK